MATELDEARNTDFEVNDAKVSSLIVMTWIVRVMQSVSLELQAAFNTAGGPTTRNVSKANI